MQAYLLLSFIAFLVIMPVFSDGFPVAMDNPGHILESYLFSSSIRQHGWLHGWSMASLAGFPLQGYPRYQIGIWLVALLDTALSLELAYKTALYLSYLFPALAIYFVLNRRFGRLAAFFAAFSFLLIRRDVIVIALNGMWNNILAVGFLVLFMHYLDLFFRAKDLRNAAFAGIFLALTLLSHVFSVIPAVIFLCIYSLVYTLRRGLSMQLSRVILIPAIAILIPSFFVLQAVDAGNWLSTVGWSFIKSWQDVFTKLLLPLMLTVPKGLVTKEVLASLSLRYILDYIIASALQLAGFALAVFGTAKARKGIFLHTIIFFTLSSLVLATGFWFFLPYNIPVLNNIQTYRFVVYIKLGLLILAAYGISRLDQKRRVFIVAAAVLFVMLFNSYYTPLKAETATTSMQGMDNVFILWDWARENVGSDTRMFYQDFYHNLEGGLGSSHLPPISYIYTGIPTVGGWWPFSTYPIDELVTSSSGMLFGRKLDDVEDEEIAQNLAMLNAKYIVSVEYELEKRLRNSGLFQEEFSSGNITTFSLVGYQPSWFAFEKETGHSLVSFKDQYIAISMDNSDTENSILVKVQHHPYWHAYIDGTEVNIEEDQHMMRVGLEKTGPIILELRYEPFRLSYLVLSIIGIALAVWFSRKRTRAL